MPGPKSEPRAKSKTGHVVEGKTALRRAGLRSRENLPRYTDQTTKSKKDSDD